MRDAENRTTVPLLNSYKHGLVRRRLLQTVTGGLKLQRAPCYVHLLQSTIYVVPLALAIPFVVLDGLKVWNEYYLALVYAFIHTLALFTLRLSVYCSRKCVHADRGAGTETQLEDDDDDDAIEAVTSCCSQSTLFFIFPSKSLPSLLLHSLLVCGLLSFTSSFVLLPRTLTTHLPLPGAVVVGIAGWLVTCGVHYSLTVNSPPETAVYRPTDLLGLAPLMRPAYLIFCATFIIVVRLTVDSMADVYIQLLYVAVCMLPLCWIFGLLPPLDALLPWIMEQTLTRLMGGSPMATDFRLLVMFLLSVFSTLTVSITAQYCSYTASLLLAVITGYLLSQDLFLCANVLLNSLRRKANESSHIQWKTFVRHLLMSTVRCSVLLIVSALLVYFSSTAKDMAKRMASRVTGGCVITLHLLLYISSACQGTYILGLFRNPLHPWRSEDVQKYKSWRKKLSYCSIPRTLVLTYVSALVMLVFVTLAEHSDTQHRWLRAIGIARIFRKVWQNTLRAQLELLIVSLLLLIVPESSCYWMTLGAGTQALLAGLGLDVFSDLLLKLRLVFMLFFKFVTKDRKKAHCCLSIFIIVGSLLFFPLLLAALLFSTLFSVPLLPLFTLPIFLISFPRTQRFWPSLYDYGSSYYNCRDSVYYQHDTPELSRALQEVLLKTDSASVQPGNFFLLRYQDRIAIATVLESGHHFLTLNIKGLEIQETSCHTIEATRIDDIFADAYNPTSLRSCFWFNCHPLNTMQPVDCAVIHTYSEARSVLTGIIDQPPVLVQFSSNLLKCIVWVLYQYLIDTHTTQEKGREDDQSANARHRVKWRRKNKVIPVVESESVHRASEPCNHDTHDSTVFCHSPEQPTVGPAVTSEEDSLSWTSIESAEDTTREAREHCGLHYQHTMSDLIPTDIPLHRDPSIPHIEYSHFLSTRPKCVTKNTRPHPLQGQTLPFPPQWLELPLLDSQVDTLLHLFPSDWLQFLCSTHTSGPPLSTAETVMLKKLSLACFSIVDVPHCSLGAAQTRPFHIHSGFCGEFPHSTDRDWLTQQNQDLYKLILKAYRYAVKLLCDETVLGEAGDCAELSDYLQAYQSDYHIGSEGEPEWSRAVLDHVPHLFSIGKSQDNDTYTLHVLTLQDQLVYIGKLNSAAVHAVWSDLVLELLYLTNDDEERYGIQAHPSLLRNLTIQAADPPLGYAVYSSGIIRCPHVT